MALPAHSFDPFHYEVVAAHRAPQLNALVSYWETKHVGERLPRRADIDPVEIKMHLPRLFMIDVLDGGPDGVSEYRYRLIGTDLVARYGRDSTGKTFAQVHGGDDRQLAATRQVVAGAVAARRPVRIAGQMFWRPDRAFRPIEGVFLPLSSDGETVDVVMGEIAFF